MPASIGPEIATPCAEPFDDDDWRFSIDWDGCRTVLFAADDGTVRLQAENLNDVTQRFPELLQAATHLRRLPAVLDGVVVVLDSQGRPDLEALGLRISLGTEGASQFPVVFLATDLLQAGRESTLSWPLERRLALLNEILERQTTVQAPDTVEVRGAGLAEAAGVRGLGAVLGRRRGAPYRAGLPSPDRLRFNIRPRATCVVAGIAAGAERPWLLLAEFEAGRLVFSGRVKGPRHVAAERWFAGRAAAVATTVAPLYRAGIPGEGGFGDVIWLAPVLGATVSHRGRLADGTLREPGLIAVRDDVDTRWCIRRDPVAPPAAAGSRAFAPTVLLPLPLEDTAALLPATR